MKKAIAMTAAIGFVVTACGSAGTNGGTASPTAKSSEQFVETEKPVVLTMWTFEGSDPQKSITQKAINKFNREHKNIRIRPEYFTDESFKQKMKAALAGNDLPDIFTYWSGDQFKTIVDANAVGDITDKLNRDAAFKNSILPGGLETFSYNGKNYAIPAAMNAVMIFYNKELMDKADAVPPITWDDLLADVDKLNAANITPIAVAGKDRWPILHWFSYLAQRLGGEEPFAQAHKGTGDFNEASFVAAGEKLVELVKKKGFESGFLGLDYRAAEARFMQGKAAIYLQGDWAVGNFVKDDAFAAKVRFVPFPAVKEGNGDTATFQGGFGFGYAISSRANKDAAYEAMKYLVGPATRIPIAEEIGMVLPFKDTVLNKNKMKPLAYEVMSYISTHEKSFFPYYDQALDPVRSDLILNAATAIVGKDSVHIKDELAQVVK